MKETDTKEAVKPSVKHTKFENIGKKDEEKQGGTLINVIRHIYTLLFVMLTFIIFRADSLSYAIDMIGRLFVGEGSNAVAFSLLTPTYIIALVCAVVFSSSVLDKIIQNAKIWILSILSIIVYLISIMMLITGGYNPFIYFRF